MKYYVYIIFSGKLNRFYIGSTNLQPEERLNQHNTGYNNNSFSLKGIPWVAFLHLECNSREQARKVEMHIKKMKSKKYINNLKQYPEMQEKLLKRFE